MCQAAELGDEGAGKRCETAECTACSDQQQAQSLASGKTGTKIMALLRELKVPPVPCPTKVGLSALTVPLALLLIPAFLVSGRV